MAKVKWGGDLTQEDIDGARGAEGYAGDFPRSGVFRFMLRSMKAGRSKEDNPKIAVFATLDGTWKEGQAKYTGCPMWDHVPMTKSAAFRAKALCEALGVTSADLLNRAVQDADGYLTKIGDLDLTKGEHYLYVNVQYREADGDYPESIRPRGGGYLPVAQVEAAADSPNGKADKPAKAKKGKKAKAGDEPPF